VARYRVLRWKDVPSLVEADGEGATESDAYLAGWAQDPDAERPGTAEEVAAAVAAELEADFQDLVMRRFTGPPGLLPPR